MSTKNHFLLTCKNRECLEKWKIDGVTQSLMASRIGCDISTIGREFVRGTDSQGNYRAIYAHKKATSRIRSRKLGKRKILQNSLLQQEVHAGLKKKWSPYQIAKKLRETYTDKAMRRYLTNQYISTFTYFLEGLLRKLLLKDYDVHISTDTPKESRNKMKKCEEKSRICYQYMKDRKKWQIEQFLATGKEI